MGILLLPCGKKHQLLITTTKMHCMGLICLKSDLICNEWQDTLHFLPSDENLFNLILKTLKKNQEFSDCICKKYQEL